jgi:hypothetical protein
MDEEPTDAQQDTLPIVTSRRKPYTESYRHLYALPQDTIHKTRQLEQSLDTIILYVRDLLR